MVEQDKFGRKLHKATCAECGQETQVPFEPDGSRPVYCRECHQKRRKPFNNRRDFHSRPSRGQKYNSEESEDY